MQALPHDISNCILTGALENKQKKTYPSCFGQLLVRNHCPRRLAQEIPINPPTSDRE